MESSDLLLIIPAVLTAFVICYVSMPVIIKVAELKNLIDTPDGNRKVHGKIMPTLGGIGIFSAFIISYSVWGQASDLVSYPFFIAALFMLFLIGVKDDILVLSRTKKVLVQVGASLLLVIGGGVVLTDLGGIFGLGEIPWLAGVALSVLIMVAVVNSFNLIDGIDGLAGGIGIIVSSILGIWFWGAGFLSLGILAFALAGALVGFLTFNMHPARIFMGDTGSMAAGFILGFLALEFLTLNATMGGEGWHIANAHVFAVSILIVPVVDTLRVTVLRSLRGKSPFMADRNHTHHKLIDTGMPPHFAAFSLWIANMLIIGFAYTTSYLEVNIQLAAVLTAGFLILPCTRFIFMIIHRLAGSSVSKEKSSRSTAAYDMN